MKKLIICLLTAAVLASCSSHKEVVKEDVIAGSNTTASSAASSQLRFLEKVVKNNATAENVVGSGDMTVKFGARDITLPAKLSMRRDKVIRLQVSIPLLGTEVVRLEFTPDYVLLMDRYNKQYMKADYNKVAFLRENGLTFYSLQALFWNQLFVPGQKTVTMDSSTAKAFNVNMQGAKTYVPVVLDNGKIKYQWSASADKGQLASTIITYNNTASGASMLTWHYSNFLQLEKKLFPATQDVDFQTYLNGKNLKGTMKLQLKNVKNSSDWEAETTVSAKYKEMKAEDILRLLK